MFPVLASDKVAFVGVLVEVGKREARGEGEELGGVEEGVAGVEGEGEVVEEVEAGGVEGQKSLELRLEGVGVVVRMGREFLGAGG